MVLATAYPDGVSYRLFEAAVERSRCPLVIRTEQSSHQQFDDNVVRPFLHRPLVVVARTSQTGGNIADPIEASHPFQCRSMVGSGYAAHQFHQFIVEKLIVLLGVEAVVGLDKRSRASRSLCVSHCEKVSMLYLSTPRSLCRTPSQRHEDDRKAKAVIVHRVEKNQYAAVRLAHETSVPLHRPS